MNIDAKRIAINKVKHYRALYHFGKDMSDKVVYSNIVKGYLFALLDLGIITNSEYNEIMDVFYYKERKVDLYADIR